MLHNLYTLDTSWDAESGEEVRREVQGYRTAKDHEGAGGGTEEEEGLGWSGWSWKGVCADVYIFPDLVVKIQW